MEYSIQELSRLAGVTTRTLRWYDQIGLLKPSRTAESGYRYYGEKEVDRLQDILFYRALGVELARIRECLDDPSFDRLSVLRGHLSVLEARLLETEDLIQAVRNTIKAEERDEMMADEKKFEAFKRRVVDENEKSFGECLCLRMCHLVIRKEKRLLNCINVGLCSVVSGILRPCTVSA